MSFSHLFFFSIKSFFFILSISLFYHIPVYFFLSFIFLLHHIFFFSLSLISSLHHIFLFYLIHLSFLSHLSLSNPSPFFVTSFFILPISLFYHIFLYLINLFFLLHLSLSYQSPFSITSFFILSISLFYHMSFFHLSNIDQYLKKKQAEKATIKLDRNARFTQKGKKIIKIELKQKLLIGLKQS